MSDYTKHYLDPSEIPEEERLVVHYIPLEEIRPTDRNPNAMTEPEYLRLKLGISSLGFVQPLIVVPTGDDEAAFEVVDGHHRYRALVELDYTAAPCVVAESWDDAQRIIARIAMNKNRGELNLTAVAEDVALLHTEFEIDVEELVATGFDVDELGEMIDAMTDDINAPKPSDIASTTLPSGDGGPARNPRPFILEVRFTTKEERNAARAALKKAGGGDVTNGLLTLAGIDE